MSIFLTLIGVLAYLFAVLTFAVAPSAIQQIFAAVLVTCGTVAFAGAAIVERLDRVVRRLPSMPDTHAKSDTPTEQPWA